MGRDYTELRKRIRAKFTNLSDFAEALGVTAPTLSLKLSGRSDWKRAEIEKCQQLLGLAPDDVLALFF